MRENTSRTGLEIAVIGMAGKFPGAKNIDEFWDNLKNGVCAITFFTEEELEKEGINPEETKEENYVKAKNIVEGIQYFDESFFNFTPTEAQVIDPQTRTFLEISWEALENAGYSSDNYNGKIGIYGGTNPNLYWDASVLLQGSELVNLLRGILSAKDYLSMLTSYKLNLKGPSLSVFTACSTSLVTIDLAYRAILTGECDIALAGGVTLSLPVKTGYHYQEGMLFSKDGYCRSFDARASGTVFGQGAGVVVLKQLTQAIEDRDFIWAVIKGSGVNNDGKEKVGITAPTVEGQAGAAQTALSLANINPETISYMEAHGTGTLLGDPIEIEGLTRAFDTKKKHFCKIGTVKSNVGHLDCAAGISGFIKTVLSLKHQLIPPSLHFEAPNPKIDFENSPFVVNTELVKWKSEKYPRRAAVNSLGIGGTNAHIILEEAPGIEINPASRKWQLLLLSATTPSALDNLSKNLADYFTDNPGINLADAAYTLQVGRKTFEYKKMLVCSTIDEAIAALTGSDPKKAPTFLSTDDKPPVIFLFPGQGSQYVNMGLDLYRTEPAFREEMDRCFEILNTLVDYNIKDILYPHSPVNSPLERGAPEGRGVSNKINQTEIAQPLLFVFEYALAKLLIKWGITPYAMIGHSIGEYVAACLSGVFSLEDALALVVLRGKLMQEMPGGAMLSVSMPESELTPLLTGNEDISLAAVNSPSHCVVSGPYETIDHFSKGLKEKEIKCKTLYTSHAFHSKMMDPILDRFEAQLKRISFKQPEIPYISNVSGNWITFEDAVDPTYWLTQLRQTVRFADGAAALLKKDNAVCVEVGPGRVLSTLVTQHPDKKDSQLIANLVRHPEENTSDDCYFITKIGQLWLYGQKIDWAAFYPGEKRQRIPLPTYPFEKKRYWYDENPFTFVENLFSSQDARKNPDIGKWFYIPSWKRTTLPPVNGNLQPSCYLLFIDEVGLGIELAKRLQSHDQDVIIVKRGSTFSRNNDQEYMINPEEPADYHSLFDELRTADRMPATITHMWSITGDEKEPLELTMEKVNRDKVLGYYSLLRMARAIGKMNYNDKFEIIVTANNMYDVIGDGDEAISPGKALLLGPIMTIAREYPNISCRCVDIALPKPGRDKGSKTYAKNWEKLIDQMFTEILTDTPADVSDEVIAYRNHIRWVRTYEPIPLAKPEKNVRLKEKGVYLITGGLGGIGYEIANYIAKNLKGKLVVTGRSSLPPRRKWEEWLNSHENNNPISEKIKKVLELEKAGAEVMPVQTNVADYEKMKDIVPRVLERFGRINGVIHSAGIIDLGGVIQRRTGESSEQVFESKVSGTTVLEQVFKKVELDFFIVFSSINSILGPFGEVAYTAANAFLDAYAYYKMKTHGTPTLSINWDLWLETGMIEEIQEKFSFLNKIKPQTREMDYPLFDEYAVNQQGDVIYSTLFSLSKDWILQEHKLMGNSVLVGTAYLEMARAAFENHSNVRTLEMRNVYFLNPLVVVENKDVQFRMILRKHDDHFEFFFMSRIAGTNGNWRAHARGEMLVVEEVPPKKHSIEEIRAKCSEQEIMIASEKFKPFEGFVGVSQRWNCLKHINIGKNQALGRIELPEAYKDDLNSYGLHPSLLDVATSFLSVPEEEKDNYLPLLYKKITVKGPLPRRFFSYARRIEDNGVQEDQLKIKFNITIMKEDGTELVDIEEFTILSVSQAGQAQANQEKSQFPLSSFLPSIDIDEEESSTENRSFQYVTEIALTYGILTAEGIEAFLRVLGTTLPQVVVSTQKLDGKMYWIKNPPIITKSDNSKLPTPRTELQTAYVAPRNEAEETLASIFINYLGIAQIGIHDDFFALGLDSLKAVDIADKISAQLDLEISIGDILNFPTIAEIAILIEGKK
jgi:acyl transferase domain-containing protein/acyl carrier protein